MEPIQVQNIQRSIHFKGNKYLIVGIVIHPLAIRTRHSANVQSVGHYAALCRVVPSYTEFGDITNKFTTKKPTDQIFPKLIIYVR